MVHVNNRIQCHYNIRINALIYKSYYNWFDRSLALSWNLFWIFSLKKYIANPKIEILSKFNSFNLNGPEWKCALAHLLDFLFLWHIHLQFNSCCTQLTRSIFILGHLFAHGKRWTVESCPWTKMMRWNFQMITKPLNCAPSAHFKNVYCVTKFVIILFSLSSNPFDNPIYNNINRK